MVWQIYQILDDIDSTLIKATLIERLLTYWWGKTAIHDDLAAIVLGSFMTKLRKHLRGTGFVVPFLEAVQWSFSIIIILKMEFCWLQSWMKMLLLQQ